MKIMAAREREACFSVGFRKKDYVGLISFGIFVIIVGIVFVANPHLVSDFSSWIGQMTDQQHLIRPVEGLINAAVLFFGLIGLSDFFKAGIRLWIAEPRRQVLVDILSGVALVLFAYLIHLYGTFALTWQMVLATEAIAVGLLVVLYSIVRYAFSK
jgi:hypothetical protein